MRTVRDLDNRPVSPCVATVGNFDGVHLAHQALLRDVVASARKQGLAAAALTFEPHPLLVLAPERAPQLLTSAEQKARLISQCGLDLLVILPFTRELSLLTPDQFAEQVLWRHLGAREVHVGENFRFGRSNAGDVRQLRELGARLGFKACVLPPVRVRGETVSSTRIRTLLEEGRVTKAARLLGRPYSVGGPIVAGSGIGHRATVPTLNLAPIGEQLPRSGVYVTRTTLSGAARPSVTNVGTKPTFGQHRLTVECFLLDFAGESQPETMEVEFLFRLRDERKFPGAKALKAQILKDVRRAQAFFRRIGAGNVLLGRQDPAR